MQARSDHHLSSISRTLSARRGVTPACWLRIPLGIGPTGLEPARNMRRPARTTASADFCRVRRHLSMTPVGHNIAGRHPNRSPRIRTAAFPLPPLHLRGDPLVVTGFAVCGRLTQVAPPRMQFVFLGAGICLRLPSDPASRRRRCPWLGVSTTASSRGLSPPSNCPCRAYSDERPPRKGGRPLHITSIVRLLD